MLMRDEDVTKRGERHPCEGQLARHAIAAIDHIDDVVADDHLRGCGARHSRTRAASGPEENEPRADVLSAGGSRTHRSRERDHAQKRTTADASHVRIRLPCISYPDSWRNNRLSLDVLVEL